MDSVNARPRTNDNLSREGSDEAARLFPQQRVIPGPDRAESQGLARRASRPPPSQGRTMRARLSRHQPAGAGPGAGGRCGNGVDPIARHHRMAGRNPSPAAAVAEGSAAPRQGPGVCDGARLRYPSGAKSESAGAAARTQIARGRGDGLGGLGQSRGPCGLREADRRRSRAVLLWRRRLPLPISVSFRNLPMHDASASTSPLFRSC